MALSCSSVGLQRLMLPTAVTADRTYLLLCTRGLEDQAEALLRKALHRDVPTWRIPPPHQAPRVSEGHAAVGKLIVGLKDGEDLPPEGLPGIIHTYALVDAATNLSDDKEAALEQLCTWVSGLGSNT